MDFYTLVGRHRPNKIDKPLSLGSLSGYFKAKFLGAIKIMVSIDFSRNLVSSNFLCFFSFLLDVSAPGFFFASTFNSRNACNLMSFC